MGDGRAQYFIRNFISPEEKDMGRLSPYDESGEYQMVAKRKLRRQVRISGAARGIFSSTLLVGWTSLGLGYGRCGVSEGAATPRRAAGVGDRRASREGALSKVYEAGLVCKAQSPCRCFG